MILRARRTSRRTLLTCLAFGVAIAVAFLIPGAAAAASLHGDHFASVSSVNGHPAQPGAVATDTPGHTGSMAGAILGFIDDPAP